ncbi:MAG: hypothetical protein JWQ63_3836 [Mucilaginibacter sp.]|nr:hypothetical protein [Mucilaginibacter sp.]
MNHFVVSVIIPNYNHAAYLKQRIESVLNQTYQDFEVIILDDKSSDNSKEIIELYRDHPRVNQIVYNEQNSGSTFKQWQKGIELAKGEFIWIAESDDWCEPTLLETLAVGLINNKKCAIAYVQSIVINAEGYITYHYANQTKLFTYIQGVNYIQEYLLHYNSIVNASMAVFRKEYYYNISKQYTSFRFCGDWLFWIELAKEGSVFVSGKFLNYFRKHEKDVSGKVNATGYNFIEELRLLKILKDDKIITDRQFKNVLANLYHRYSDKKSEFTNETRVDIEQLFYFEKNKSYKSFLMRKRRINIIKTKVKLPLKFIFEFFGFSLTKNI